jgi:ribosomal-protein-alanine N-acetyltransferase
MPTRPIPKIETERLLLTLPGPDVAPRMVAFYHSNREHFAPWDPERSPDFYTAEWWRNQLKVNRREFLQDRSLRLVILPRGEPDGPVMGVINFSVFVRGSFQACLLGYSLDATREGQGFMTEALTAATTYAFEELGLHRIMANYQPHNLRSGRLLERLGFAREGFARDYLFLAGAWCDHILTALVRPSPAAM